MSENLNAVAADTQVQPEPAIVVLNISSDAMEVEMTFQEAVGAPTLKPVFEDVAALLAEKGIVYGINEVALKAVCDHPMYNRPFTVAKGKEPKTGADGFLKYLVETSRDLRPKLREDGTVDYRDLGFIQPVVKDQPLCEIHLAEKGEDGCDVYGNLREGRWGKAPENPMGKNTHTNEDGTMLVANCDGSAEVKRGVIDVIDVLRINGNVDNSTGDIEFAGDVIIDGDVGAGFRVVSQASVTVRGSVEAATVQAAGDIVVGTGINGMDRGSIAAGGNLKCKYIQSCYIKAAGDIFADSIMYCNLECGGNVELAGKRAALIGGRASIAGTLTAKTLGTESHVATQITMASTGVEKEQELRALADKVKAIDGEIRKLIQLLTRYEDLIKQGRVNQEQAKMLITVKDNYQAQMKLREETQQQLEKAKAEQLEASRAGSYIVCKDRVHSGVSITFGPLVLKVNSSFVNSRILIIDNDIAVRPL